MGRFSLPRLSKLRLSVPDAPPDPQDKEYVVENVEQLGRANKMRKAFRKFLRKSKQVNKTIIDGFKNKKFSLTAMSLLDLESKEDKEKKRVILERLEERMANRNTKMFAVTRFFRKPDEIDKLLDEYRKRVVKQSPSQKSINAKKLFEDMKKRSIAIPGMSRNSFDNKSTREKDKILIRVLESKVQLNKDKEKKPKLLKAVSKIKEV